MEPRPTLKIICHYHGSTSPIDSQKSTDYDCVSGQGTGKDVLQWRMTCGCEYVQYKGDEQFYYQSSMFPVGEPDLTTINSICTVHGTTSMRYLDIDGQWVTIQLNCGCEITTRARDIREARKCEYCDAPLILDEDLACSRCGGS